MSSVTKRIQQIKQPKGGYINISKFDTHIYNDNIYLNVNENISPQIIGTAVDYFTRYIIGNFDGGESFRIPWNGALIARDYYGVNDAVDVYNSLWKYLEEMWENYLELSLDYSYENDDNINDLDVIEKIITDNAIISACKLVTFDVWVRNPINALKAKMTYKDINPNRETIDNIRTLIQRNINFFRDYGPVIKTHFTFEPKHRNKKQYQKILETDKSSYGGYTSIVNSGDGDYLTEDTILDLKVSKSKPTKEDTLQILMYWIMGQHSRQNIFEGITKIGIFNPRLNTAYLLEISEISSEIIKTIEQDVIGYQRNFINNKGSE